MDYPEHEKLKAIQRESQAIGEFMEWLQKEKDLDICEFHDDGRRDPYFPYQGSVSNLLEEFFDIGPKKLEAEKQAMLDEMRKERE